MHFSFVKTVIHEKQYTRKSVCSKYDAYFAFFPRLLKACLYDKLNLLLKVCTQYWVSSTSLIDKNIFEFNKKKFIKEKAIRFEIFLIITVVTVSLSQVKITGNENLFSSFLRCHNQRIVILRRSIDHYCHQSPKMTLW